MREGYLVGWRHVQHRASASRPAPPGRSISGRRAQPVQLPVRAARGGTFVLRVEDTDIARSTIEFEQDILDGLHWLGIAWDEGPAVAGG